MTYRTLCDAGKNMKEYNIHLVVDILRKEYPEIELKIRQRIDDDIPGKVDDLSHIPEIIRLFTQIRGIDDLVMAIVRYGNKEIWENIDLLLAVVMLFYHPEKVLQLTDEKAKYGVMSAISNVLQCSNKLLQRRISQVIVSFKAYKAFREETYRIYELINETKKLL